MKWVLGFLVAVLVLAGVGDALARSAAEKRAADHVQRSLDLDEAPKVSLGGWPFLVHALRGSFPTIEVTVGSLRARGVELEEVNVILQDVEVELEKILAGSAEGVRSKSGRGQAALTEDELNRVVARAGPAATVRLDGNQVFVEVEGREVPGRVEVTGSQLVIRSKGLPDALRVELPGVIEGLTYEEVEVRDGRAHLSFGLSGARLRAP
ncbi:MAG: LmeA family phospholipid-binding protein [Actinomycetota bacterium]